MDNINIYEADGTLWANVKVSADCYYRDALEGDESVELRWESYDYVRIPVGSYVIYNGRTYRLTEPHEPTRRTESIYTFTPVFYSQSYHWKKAMACLYEYSTAVTYTDTNNTISATIPEPTSRELDWSFTGNLPDALFMLIQMIKNETGETWTAHYVPEIQGKLIEYTAQGSSVFDFLSKIAEQCGKEFYFDYANATPQVCVGTLELETTGTHTEDGRVLLYVGDDVYNPSVSSEAEDYFTRFYFFGSTRNIVQPNSVTKSSVVNRRLPLCPTKVTTAGYNDMNYYPKGFIDINRTADSYNDRQYVPDLPPFKVFAQSVFFDDIYPHSDLKIETVQTRHIAVIDDAGAETGENMPIYYVKLVNKNGAAFNFNSGTYPNGDMLPTLVPSISFRSGYLQGLEYELIYHATNFTVSTTGTEGQGGRVTIQAPCFEIVFDTNSNPRLPNDNIKPQVNDECTLFNIHMPQEYIWNAQKELEQKAIDYINEKNVDKNTYTLQSNPARFEHVSALRELVVGKKVKMTYPNGEVVLSRVIEVEKHIDLPCDCTITLGYSSRQGSIETLRQVIDDTSANVETVVKTGDKTKAQLLGLKNGYLAQKETFDAAFDPDGYFDGSRIKPLTVETQALKVGSRSQQFTLSGINFSVAKYTSGEGILSWNCTNGKLSHFTIDEDCILQWNIPTGTQALSTYGTTTQAQYIYAKVDKDGFPDTPTGGIKVNSNNGTFVVTPDQKRFNDDPTYYYFLVGTVSQELTESGSSYKSRIISLTYGTTTINGRQVTTGVIRSSDANHGVIIDLDNGTITGKIQFLSGGQAVDAEQYINNTVDAEVGALGVANRNFLRYSELIDKSKPTFSTSTAQPNGSYVFNGVTSYGTNQSTYILVTFPTLEIGQKYTFSFKYNRQLSAQTLVVSVAGMWPSVTTVNDTQWRVFSVTFTATADTTRAAIYINQASDSWVVSYKEFKLEKGEAATEWELAPEDISELTKMQFGGTNILRKSKSIYPLGSNTQPAPWAESKWRNSGSGTATRTIIMEGASNYPTNAPAATNILEIVSTSASSGETSISQNLITAMVVGERYVLSFFARATSGSPKIYIQLNSGSYGGVVDSSTIATSAWKQYSVSCLHTQEQANAGGGSIYVGHYSSVGTIQICGIKLEKGTVATDWSPAPEDTDYLKTALAEATSGTTEIEGGLINTKMIQAGSGSSQAGMVGLESLTTAFFAGGSVADAESFVAPVVIKRDGFAKFGVLFFDPSGIITMRDTTASKTTHLVIKNGEVPAPQAQDIEYNNSNNTPTNIIYSSFTAAGTNSQVNTRQQVWSAPLKTGISNKHNGMNVLVNGSTATYTITGGVDVVVYAEIYFRVTGTERLVAMVVAKIGSGGSVSGTVAIPSQSFTFNASGSTGAIDARMYVTAAASGCQVSVGSVQYGWYHDCTSLQTTLADNGLAVIRDNQNFFRAIAGSSGMTTTIKGNTDIAGVLWAGEISSDGTPSTTPTFKNVNVNLTKASSSPHPSAGVYNFALSGASSAMAIATVKGTHSNGWTAKIYSNNSTSLQIRIYNDNTAADSAFNLLILGKT